MTTRTYGFAYPLNYDDVKPGMLVSALYGSRHIIGLAFQGDREILVAVFDDGDDQEPRPPYVIDLADIHSSLTLIPGDREIEPVDDYSFDLLPRRRAGPEGFFITSSGEIGLAVTHREFGGRKLMMLNFDTGEPMGQGGQMAFLPPFRLFVVEPGREARREVIAKQTG